MTYRQRFAIALPNLNLPDLNLPDLNLSASLSSLAALADQLQGVINIVIAHPIWAIALLLLAITFIQILADLAKRFVKAVLTFILKLPLSFSQWIWQRATARPVSESEDQIEQLIQTLERLQSEQNQAMEQLKSLLEQKASEKARKKDTEQTQPAATEERKSSATVSPEVG